jgi:prepilin-type N-terminal cleavage/methylation domain-containing protein
MRSSRGFTLIELLVVVAIIALLIAILLPSLANARELAKTAQCAANMRQVGSIIHLFAAENDGRAPGYASTTSSIAWQQILNAETLQRTTGTKYAISGRFGNVSDARMLSCTKYVPKTITPTDTRRPWVLNGHANAANEASTGYGDLVALGRFDKQWYYDKAGIGQITEYYLGSKLQYFGSAQVLMHESYAGNDVAGSATTPDRQGRITDTIAGHASYMAVSAGVGGSGYSRDNIAFRHPYFKGTNVLRFDASVVTLKPSDDVADGPGMRSKWAIIR